MPRVHYRVSDRSSVSSSCLGLTSLVVGGFAVIGWLVVVLATWLLVTVAALVVVGMWWMFRVARRRRRRARG